MQHKRISWFTRVLSSSLLMTMLLSHNTAQAAILFQDDDFHDIPSEAILIDSDGAGANDTSVQFGNDGTASENGTINWDITLNEFQFDNTVDITGDLDVSGNADFTDATEFHLREVADEAAATCTTIDELVLDTTENRIYVCTAVGSPGTWVGADAGSSQDFEDVYATDGDDTLTTSGGDFTVDTGGGDQNFTLGAGEFDITGTGLLDFNAGSFDMDLTGGFAVDAGAASNLTTSAGDLSLEATAGSTNITGGEAAADAINIDASNAAGGIDVDAGTGGIAMDTTGVFSVDGVGNSNVTTDSGNLALETTTSGDVDITGADNVDVTSTAGDVTLTAGDDMIFDDAQLTGNVQLTETATDFDATFSSDGIIDNLNSFASTATGEGASNVGIEDAGGFFTGTDTEAALQELGAVSGSNAAENEVLTFYPEYPDAVLFADGSDNRGRMDALYDDTNDEHHYRWTTRRPAIQDFDIRFRFPLPDDFSDTNDFTFRYRTGTAVAGDNTVDVTVNNDTDSATCGSSTGNTTAGTWATGTITEATLETGCTGGSALDAGDIMEVIVKLYDTSGAGDFADIGFLTLDYDN